MSSTTSIPISRRLRPRPRPSSRPTSAAFADRVEKLKGSSATVLPELGVGGRRFDLAYIDGSHVAADVYRDAALIWPLIEPGGWIMFDDYEWDGMEEELDGPSSVSMLPGRLAAITARSSAATSSPSPSCRVGKIA